MSTKKLKKKSVSIDSNESDVVQADAEIQKTKNDKPNKTTVKKIKKKVPAPTEKIKGVEDDKELVAESSDNNKIGASDAPVDEKVEVEDVVEAEVNINCEEKDNNSEERKLSSKSSKSDVSSDEVLLCDQIENLKKRKKSLKSEIKDLDIQMAMSLPTEALKTNKKKAEAEMISVQSEMQDLEAQLEENEIIKRAEAEAMEELEAKQNYYADEIIDDLSKTESELPESADNEDDDKIVISENNGTVAFNKTGYRKNEKATMQ